MHNSKPVINNQKDWLNEPVSKLTEHPQYGWTTSARKVETETGLKLLRTTDISHGDVNWETVPVCLEEPPQPEKYLLKNGDILVSRAGSVGLSCYIQNPPKAVFASYLIRFRAKEEKIKSKYLYYYFQSPSYWDAIGAGEAGIAIPNVNATKLAEILVDYPVDLNEQDRIIKKLEELLPKVKSSHLHINHSKKLLKQFRQSILSAAVTGRLTEDWREKNIIQNTIRSAFSKVKFEQSEIEGWLKTTVNSICKSFGGGTPSRGNADYWNGNIAWVSSGDVKQNFIEQGSETITKAGLDNSSASLCPIGSVIIVVRSGILKHTLPVAIVKKPLAINQDIKCFDCGDDKLNHWLFLFLKGNAKEILELNREGTTVQSVKYETLKDLEINIPSIEEQEEIAKRVSDYFDLADKVEKQIEKAELKVSKLTQAILAKTFRSTYEG